VADSIAPALEELEIFPPFELFPELETLLPMLRPAGPSFGETLVRPVVDLGDVSAVLEELLTPPDNELLNPGPDL
jgi:hypothetical protein